MIQLLPSGRALRYLMLPAITALCLAISPKAQGQFTTGNVVVLQVGDGAAVLSTAATPIFLKEYNTTTAGQSSAVYILNMPTTGTHRITMSGSGNTEGLMTLSSDSLHLVVSGYDAATGTAAINGTASATVSRVIDTIGKSANAGRAAASNSAYSAQSFRGATKNGGDNYWGSAGAGGTYYFGNAATPVAIQTNTANNRGILAANGNLYISSGAGTNGIYKVTGQPTAASTAAILIPFGATGTSPLAFAINTSETIAYIADDRTTSAGGIQRWDNVAGTWTNTYTFSLGTSSANGARGLTVDWSGTNPVIYATSAEAAANRLVKLVDNGATATYTVLAAAPANTAFRGVTFTPKAIATCTNPVLTATATARKCSVSGTISLAITSGTTPTTYAWTGPAGFTASTQNISGLAAGTYSVIATTPGGCTGTTSATVIDSASFTATLLAGGITTICQGDTVLLTANLGIGYTYQFSNASGAIPGATGVNYKAGASGVYTVTVTSGINCTSTSAPVTVTVNPKPAATVVPAGPLSICPGSTIVLHTNRTSGLTYQWKLNNVNVAAAGQDSIYTASAAGSYTVLVTNTSTGCNATSSPVVISLYARPDTTVTPAGTQAFCAGDSVKLHAVPGSGATYQWKNAVGNIASATDSVYTVHNAGAYKVVVTSVNGCKDSSSAHVVTVNPYPVAAISASADTVCQKSLIILTAPVGANYTYQWFFGGTTLPMTTSSIPVTGIVFGGPPSIFTDSAYVIINNGTGCTDTSAWKKLVFTPLPQPLITNTGGVLGTVTSYASYQWIKDGTAINGATNATYSPAVNGRYNVSVTNAYGCSDTAATSVTVSGLGFEIPVCLSDLITIYPNPASGMISIYAPQPVNIQLRDMQGRLVMNVNDAKTADISGLANGIYAVTFTDKTGIIIKTTRFTKAGQ